MRKEIDNIFIVFVFMFSFCSYISAQAPNWEWAKRAGGGASDIGYGIATDNFGNIYVTGHFSGSAIPFGSSTLSSVGGFDFFIAKYDASGNVLWAKSLGGTSNDGGRNITVDAFGDIYVTGFFLSSSITVGSVTLNNSGAEDVFTIKYNPSGNVLWVTSAGGSNSDACEGIAADALGNVYLTGNFHSSSIVFGTVTLANAGGNDIFIVKYDSIGNVVWAKRAGGAYGDEGNGIAVGDSGNIYITGNFASPAILFGTNLLLTSGQFDVFVVKYDGNGNVLWAKGGGGTATDQGFDIATDSFNNVYVTGNFTSPSIIFGSDTLINSGVFTVKYDKNGNILWSEDSESGGVGYAISTDMSGNVFVAGIYIGSMIIFGTDTLHNASNSIDMFIVKYDAIGNIQWAKSAGGTDVDEVEDITIDIADNVCITGYFESSTIAFGPDILVNSATSIYDYDYFIAKTRGTTTGFYIPYGKHDVLGFPNPSNGLLRINNNIIHTMNYQIEIYNVFGKNVYSSTQQFNNLVIDISSQPSGVYFLQIKTGDQSFTQKIIIQK